MSDADQFQLILIGFYIQLINSRMEQVPENIPDIEQYAGLSICLILYQYSFPF